jgi:hypothetical protein
MKSISLVQVSALVFLAMSTTCSAITINDQGAGLFNGTDVGAVDYFIAEEDKQGNPTAETAWVNSVLSSTGITFTVKNGDVAYFSTNESGVFAFDLLDEPSYYIVKNATRVALFKNVEAMGFGVFDTSDLSSSMNLPSSGYTISHVTQFAGNVATVPPAFTPLTFVLDNAENSATSVPEPDMVVLLGAGLLGMGLAGRKRLSNR